MRRHVNAPLLISLLALFVSLSGGAYALTITG
jgi:hypothetical protein